MDVNTNFPFRPIRAWAYREVPGAGEGCRKGPIAALYWA